MRSLALAAAAACTLLLPACGSSDKKDAQPPQTGSLARTLDMTDKDGKRYGTVEMDPVGGGRVLDAEGRVIGRIVSPDR